ncbi:MAG: PH domain-containing protein [Chitinophagaceae bacterium]
MDFLNELIDTTTLPHADRVDWKPVEKKYLTVLRLQWLVITIVIFIAATALIFFAPAMKRPGIIFITISALLIPLLYFIFQELSFRSKAYAMREHDILYRHGWFIRSTAVCPFGRIQHCTVHSGPIERRYKLASLTLYTAASGEGDMKIHGLPEAAALSMREFIMKKIAANEGTSH